MGRSGSTASVHTSNCHNNNTTKRVKSKDELFSEFCERAGRRYTAPKEIYFIDTNDDELKGYDHVADEYEQMMHRARRSSMGQPTTSMRNSNLYASNSSLHKSYPKNLFDLEQRNIQNNPNKMVHQQNNSQRPDHSPSNRSADSRRWTNEYSSQTLPRDFLKRNLEFDTSQHDGNSRLSEEQHYYNNNNQSHRTNIDENQRSYRNKSQDSLLSSQRPQRASHGSQDDIVNWPNAIPASPSGYSRGQYQIRPGNLYVGSVTKGTSSHHYGQISGRREAPMGQNHQQQQQQQARQSPDGDFGTFDLDRIETERRKSHASLFESAIDFENGTAV